MLQCHFFAHLQTNTVGNTGTDVAGLVHEHHLVDLGHEHHLVDLGLYVMLLENSWNIVGPILVYISRLAYYVTKLTDYTH